MTGCCRGPNRKRTPAKQDPHPRDLIAARLVTIGKSKYWLAKQQTTLSWRIAWDFLRGVRDTKGAAIAEMLGIVGLRIAPDTKRKGAGHGRAKRSG